jgi:6,7-dimethyl-8-ribityllumazine synthase
MVEARRGRQAKDAPLEGVRILVVESGYYKDIADALLAGARRALDAAKARYDVVTVPGALEIPQAAVIALDAARGAEAYDGVVALGCVIRGETSHYDIVAGESARADGHRRDARRAGRQRDSHRRYRCTSARACQSRRRRQGWRRRRCRARLGAPQAGPAQSAQAAMSRAPEKAGPRKANRHGAARLAAVQALYQMDMAGAGLNEILAQFESHWLGREVEGDQYLPAEQAFFRDIVPKSKFAGFAAWEVVSQYHRAGRVYEGQRYAGRGS